MTTKMNGNGITGYIMRLWNALWGVKPTFGINEAAHVYGNVAHLCADADDSVVQVLIPATVKSSAQAAGSTVVIDEQGKAAIANNKDQAHWADENHQFLADKRKKKIDKLQTKVDKHESVVRSSDLERTNLKKKLADRSTHVNEVMSFFAGNGVNNGNGNSQLPKADA